MGTSTTTGRVARTRTVGVVTTLAVDIGGTKLAVGIVDDDGVVHHRLDRPTGGHADGDALFATLRSMIGEVTAAAPALEPTRCGVGCGGPMRDAGAAVSPLNIPVWREFPLRERLEAATALPTFVDNDAKALALGEGWRGAARGATDFLAMVVSTGVGGGIVSRGRLLDGATGNAGHIGHVFVADGTQPWPGHPAGLLETEASGTGIAQRSGRPAVDAPVDLRVRTGTLVGRAVASVANLLDLRLAVVGGSVALGFGEPFFAAAQAEIDRICVLDYSRGTVVVPAGLGADGPLVGAAAVALRGSGVDIGIG